MYEWNYTSEKVPPADLEEEMAFEGETVPSATSLTNFFCLGDDDLFYSFSNVLVWLL